MTSFENLLNLAHELYPTNPSVLHDIFIWIVSERFRRFLLGYAKAINKQQDRVGSLFQKPFRRKLVPDKEDQLQVCCYIHHNPIHHDYTIDYDHYEWSSYKSYLKVEKYDSHHLFNNRQHMLGIHETYKNKRREDWFSAFDESQLQINLSKHIKKEY